MVFYSLLQCPYPVSMDVLTVSNIIPELLAPLTTVADGKTTPDQTHTTSNHYGLNAGISTYLPNAAVSRGNQFYPATPTPNRQSHYSTAHQEFSDQYFVTPTNAAFPQRIQYFGPCSSLNCTNNAHTVSSTNGYTLNSATTNSSLDLTPMEAGNVLDELSALFEDNVMDVLVP